MKYDTESKQNDLPHLTQFINSKRQESKDYLLRIAASVNPLIDQSIMKSKLGQAALNSFTSRNFIPSHHLSPPQSLLKTIDQNISPIEMSKKRFNRNTETTIDKNYTSS